MKIKKRPYQGYNRKQLKTECTVLRDTNNMFWNTIAALRTRKEDLEGDVEIQQRLIEKLKQRNCDLVCAHTCAESEWEEEKAALIKANIEIWKICDEQESERKDLEKEISELQGEAYDLEVENHYLKHRPLWKRVFSK